MEILSHIAKIVQKNVQNNNFDSKNIYKSYSSLIFVAMRKWRIFHNEKQKLRQNCIDILKKSRYNVLETAFFHYSEVFKRKKYMSKFLKKLAFRRFYRFMYSNKRRRKYNNISNTSLKILNSSGEIS